MVRFRQPGDLGRYIAFNDPGQPGAGFSSYEEYLNAGNKPFNTQDGTLPTKLGGGLNSLVSQPQQQLLPIKLGGSQGNMGTSPNGQLAGGFAGIVNNSIRPGGGLTLAGMAQQPIQQPIQQPMQQPMQQPIQQPMQQPIQQPLGNSLSSLNQQPQQINGGIRSLLDSYIGNYINNYFKNALR